MVVPERKDESHSALEGLAHAFEATARLEAVSVAEQSLLCVAEVIGDGVVSGAEACQVRLRVLNDNSVLNIETADFDEVTSGCVVSSDELRDDGDLLVCIDGETLAEERLSAHAEGVIITTILVANSVIALVAITAVSTGATSLSSDRADVRGHRRGHGISLPDIHLVAACAVAAGSRIYIIGGRGPVKSISLK